MNVTLFELVIFAPIHNNGFCFIDWEYSAMNRNINTLLFGNTLKSIFHKISANIFSGFDLLLVSKIEHGEIGS